MSINIHYCLEREVNIPITFHSKNSNLYVSLTLTKKRVNTNSQGVIKTSVGGGVTKLTLVSQGESNGVYEYGTVLTDKQIREVGIYTGYIEVRKSYQAQSDQENPVLELVNVNLSVVPSLLDLNSDIISSTGKVQLSFGEMISTLYNFLYISPRFQTLDNNDNLVVTYSHYGFDRKIVLFRGSELSYLPAGSTFTVINSLTGKPLNNYYRAPLLNTNNLGQDSITLEQLTTDGQPASYGVIVDAPKGDYIAYAEYVANGVHKQTQIQNISL